MKKILFIIFLTSLVLVSACSFFQDEDDEEVIIPEEPEDISEEPEEKPDQIYRSVFNGQELSENQDTYQAFGIMIENSPASRPHSGLGLADVVYETAVETYTISRFMAVYASQHPTKVGPVRSARIPFVRMIQEWGLPYAHFGSAARGQGDAKSLIESLDIPIRFDGHLGINDEFYSRDKARRAPHNAYFNGQDAKTKIPELEYEKHFEFGEKTKIDGQNISRLSLSYSSNNQVLYEFDPDERNYLRYINNDPMMDEYMAEQIRVRNIINLHAPHTTAESVVYVLVDFIGQGKAEYFIDGKYEQGTWRKDSYDDKTEFFDAEGNPVILLPGNTWIQVVHDNVDIIKE